MEAKSTKPHTLHCHQHDDSDTVYQVSLPSVSSSPDTHKEDLSWSTEGEGGRLLGRYLQSLLVSSVKTGYHLPKPFWDPSRATCNQEHLDVSWLWPLLALILILEVGHWPIPTCMGQALHAECLRKLENSVCLPPLSVRLLSSWC